MAKTLAGLNLIQLMSTVKNGATMQSLCEEYNCSEEDFKTRLGEICTRKGTIDSVLADIARNDAKANPDKAAAAAPEREVSRLTLSSLAGLGGTKATKSSNPELNKLIDQQEELTNRISDLDNQNNELLNKHYSHTRELREREEAVEAAKAVWESASKALATAQSELDKQQKLYDDSVETDRKLTEGIAAVKASREQAERELEETKKEIYALSHATIKVQMDGTFVQTSGKTQLIFNEAGSDALYRELSEKEEYQDLSVKKVRTLARLFKVVEHSDLELEIEFDDEEIGRAYRQA